jgi:hypothetical protein
MNWQRAVLDHDTETFDDWRLVCLTEKHFDDNFHDVAGKLLSVLAQFVQELDRKRVECWSVFCFEQHERQTDESIQSDVLSELASVFLKNSQQLLDINWLELIHQSSPSGVSENLSVVLVVLENLLDERQQDGLGKPQ